MNEVSSTTVADATEIPEVFGPGNADMAAIAVAVNQEEALLVFGGFNSITDASALAIYDITEPLSPTRMKTLFLQDTGGRLTSVASGLDTIAVAFDSAAVDIVLIPPTAGGGAPWPTSSKSGNAYTPTNMMGSKSNKSISRIRGGSYAYA